MKRLVVILVIILMTFLFIYYNNETWLLKKVSGNYQLLNKEGTSIDVLHLYIGMHNGEERFITIYDNGGVVGGEEKPWIVGTISSIDRKRMKISLDAKLFQTINSEWVINNNELVLDYSLKDETLSLANEKMVLFFKKQEYPTN